MLRDPLYHEPNPGLHFSGLLSSDGWLTDAFPVSLPLSCLNCGAKGLIRASFPRLFEGDQGNYLKTLPVNT